MEAILRGDVALREEQVVLVAREDVRHAPGVANDFDRLAQPGQRNLTINLRQRVLCLRRQVWRRGYCLEGEESGDENKQADKHLASLSEQRRVRYRGFRR